MIYGAASVRGRSGQLRTGTETLIGAGALEVEAVAPEAAARRLAWRDHMLVLNGETIGEAAAEVGRQSGARFVFANPDTANLRVGGYIDTRDPEVFADLLRTHLSLTVQQRDDGALVVER